MEPVPRLDLVLLQFERCSGSRYSRTQESWIGYRLVPYTHSPHSSSLESLCAFDLGKPLFPLTGTFDLLPSCPVPPYLTLSVRYLSHSLSLFLSVFVFLSLAFWWVSRSLTDCVHFCIAFYVFHFFIGFFFFMIRVQSRALVRTRS